MEHPHDEQSNKKELSEIDEANRAQHDWSHRLELSLTVLSGCGGQATQNPVQKAPSVTPAQGSDAPKLNPEVTAVARNGGIGDSLAQILKVYGKPNAIEQKMKGDMGTYRFQNDLFIVMFMEGRAYNITAQLDTANKSMPFKNAETYAKNFLPTDSVFVRSYDIDPTQRVDVYQSNTVAPLFSSANFTDENGNVKPGMCSIAFTHDGDTVNSFVAVTGASK